MSDNFSKPVKYEEKPIFRHAIVELWGDLEKTTAPILDAISAAGWQFVCHPVNGVQAAWLPSVSIAIIARRASRTRSALSLGSSPVSAFPRTRSAK
jgi:hypothetical protein